MPKTRTVAVCGDNLVMSTVAATLREKFQCHLQRMDVSAPEDLDKPDTAMPDVIIFDLATEASDFAIRWLGKYPGILLIGVDLGDNRMLVFSGRQSRLLTVDDLARVLEVESP